MHVCIIHVIASYPCVYSGFSTAVMFHIPFLSPHSQTLPIDQSPPIQEVIDTGCVPRIVEFLTSEEPSIQVTASVLSQ